MIVIGDNLLPIIVIAESSFDLSITDIASVISFVYVISDSFCIQRSKLVCWRYSRGVTRVS